MAEENKNVYIEAALTRIKETIYCHEDMNGLVREKDKPLFRKVNGKLFFSPGTVESIQSAMKMQFRDDDIIVASWPKAGSTWMRHIVLQLISDDYFNGVTEHYFESPMIEFMGSKIVNLMPSPRVLKTHFDYNCCPKSDTSKYILVVRNPKDVLISFYHHMRQIPSYEFENGQFDVFFNIFIKGEIEFGSYFDYLYGWAPKINDSNILLVKYEDLYNNREFHIMEIAKFIGDKAIERVNEPKNFQKIINESTISSMKKDIERFTGRGSNMKWFIRKGGSRGWRNILNKEQSDIIDRLHNEKLSGTIFEKMWEKEMEWIEYKNYTVLQNIITGDKPIFDKNITLILHISNDRSLEPLKNHLINWEGPISLGVYMHNEKILSTESICTICNLKNIINDNKHISVHFIFNKIKSLNLQDIKNLKNSTCKLNLEKKCFQTDVKKSLTRLLNYPINIIRNVARLSSRTKYLLLSDFDLMFSQNFQDKVIPLLNNKLSKKDKKIYVIRIFEILSENYEDRPKNKTHLFEMLKNNTAYVFYSRQIEYYGIPNLTNWLENKEKNISTIQSEYTYDSDIYEPQFIIDKDAPYHDEHFGYPYRDNMNLRWSLCLRDYKFLVLNDVFMYHLGKKSEIEVEKMREIRKLGYSRYKSARKNFENIHRKKYGNLFNKCLQKRNVTEIRNTLTDNLFTN
uniref:Sulfotransfer_1 domain-containing protein n=1 Tax=Parastrongyloides trichosuri TaxID=131310 RepID=A0A0N5A6K9_PARTI